MSFRVIAGLAGVVGFVTVVGTPHLLIDAECEMIFGHCGDTDVACTYQGIQGNKVTLIQMGGVGQCPKIKLLPFDWTLLKRDVPTGR